MKIHITAVIESPLTQEENQAYLDEQGITEEEMKKSMYSEIRKGITRGYCSQDESVWVKNIQIVW